MLQHQVEEPTNTVSSLASTREAASLFVHASPNPPSSTVVILTSFSPLGDTALSDSFLDESDIGDLEKQWLKGFSLGRTLIQVLLNLTQMPFFSYFRSNLG